MDPFPVVPDNLIKALAAIEDAEDRAAIAFEEAVRHLCNYHRCHVATGHMSDTWSVFPDRAKEWTSEYMAPNFPIIRDLKELEEAIYGYNIGPTNNIHFTFEEE